MNRIANVRTAELWSQDGTTHAGFAVFVTVALRDLTAADEFIAEVARTFLCQRFISPVTTAVLLITLHSPLLAVDFASVWRRLTETDSLLRYEMQTFRLANVVRGTPQGAITEDVSLLLRPDDPNNPNNQR